MRHPKRRGGISETPIHGLTHRRAGSSLPEPFEVLMKRTVYYMEEERKKERKERK